MHSGQTDHRSTRPLIAFLLAATISRLGNYLAALAIPWFVLTTTGSATSTALSVAVGTIPIILTGIFGGAIVDRVGYRQSSIVSDVASGISTLMIPALHFSIGIEFWHLLVFVFAGALLDAPGVSARRSLFPDLVAQTSMTLERANALYAISSRVATLVGAPLAGILIATIGAANLLFITTAGFAISALMFVVLIPNLDITVQPSQDQTRGLKGYVAEIREGFTFMWGDRTLFWIFISSSIGSLLAEPLYAIILQVYVNEKYDSAENLGYILAALATGSLAGNAIYAALSDRFPRRALIITGFGVRALAFTVFAFVPPWWIIAAAIFIGAVALEPVNPLYHTIMQERIPAGMRGRVYGVATAIQVSTFPIGIMFYGYLLDSIGLESTLLVFVLANLLLPIMLAIIPALRNLKAPGRLEAAESVQG
jgi:MFS family permease